MRSVYTAITLVGMGLVFVAGCHLLAVRGRSTAGILLMLGAPALSVATLVDMLLGLLYRFGIVDASTPLAGSRVLYGFSTVSAIGMFAIGIGVWLVVRGVTRTTDPQQAAGEDA